MNHNLYAALRNGFPANLGDIAVETADGAGTTLRYSFRDLDQGSALIANLLASLALPAGSRVVVQVDKSVEALMLYLAVLRAGHVFVPLNPAYQASELAHFIADAEPAVVVCSGRNFGWIARLSFAAGCGHVYTLNDDRSGTLLERAAFQSDVQVPASCAADDLAAILYTSGTTGRSKGAMLSHANLLSNAQVLHSAWQWRSARDGGERDVLIHALPIFHVHGLFVAIHGALLSGSRMIWCARFDPDVVLARLPEASLFMGVPTMYVRLLAHPALNANVCKRMRLFVSGSAPLRADTHQAWQRATGHVILERYGMSETLMLTSNPYAPASARKAGTVGPPLPGTGLRIRTAQGQNAAVDEVGDIEVQGPSVFSGYWRLPEKTRSEFTADGWFRTGDVGQLNGDGYVTIVGRSKDLVITGGYNVYPAEVESYLNQLPGVADSAVVGVPHADFGEAVVAAVVAERGAKLDPAALVKTLKGQIAGFKVPKQIVVLDELPRNAMGKVQKNLLRERWAALAGTA